MEALSLFEGNILLWIQENLRCAFLTPPMKLLSLVGDAGALWIAIALVLLCIKRTRRIGIFCAASILLTFIVVNCAAKPLIARARPYEQFKELINIVGHQSDKSFPSGHAANGFACAWALWRCAPRRFGIPALIVAALISLSRLYVGVHFPTDVLCGVLIGIVCSEIALRIVRRVETRAAKRRQS